MESEHYSSLPSYLMYFDFNNRNGETLPVGYFEWVDRSNVEYFKENISNMGDDSKWVMILGKDKYLPLWPEHMKPSLSLFCQEYLKNYVISDKNLKEAIC